MAQALTELDRYVSDFRTFEAEAAAGDPAWIRRAREHALDRFRELGFPTARRGNEKWKYTNVAPIARTPFQHALTAGAQPLTADRLRGMLPWDEEWARLVFVDGRFSEDLSKLPLGPEGVRVGNLADAVAANDEAVRGHLARYAAVEDDAFTALNTAFVREGAFVQLPPDGVPEAPLHLVHVSTNRGGPAVSHPRVLILAGRNSKLTLVDSYLGLSDGPYLTNLVGEIVLDEGARVDHYRFLREGSAAFHVGTTKVYQEKDSTFNSVSFVLGCAIARNDIHVLLDAPGGTCVLNGLYMTSGTQHVDNAMNIDHLKPHCTSSQYWKGILAGRSRAVYSGQVVVHKDAQKTNAQQADKNLILSDDAEVDTKPSLLIYADDVQCAHGATAGHIDEDSVFYLRSRGIDLETASRILVNGFAKEIIDTIQVDGVREFLDRLTASALPEFKFSERAWQ